MELVTSFFTADFFSALLAIIVIDLVLAGDNAIVIALAARNLPAHQQKKAIVWGTIGAIGVRALMTLAVVWLLKIPGLLLAGGAALVWIAFNLLADAKDEHHDGQQHTSLWSAMKTVIIADAVMGLDNVLAVAGAAHGSFALVVMGLLISVPLVVWGSSMVLKLVERFPLITYLGAGILAWTAANMIVSEPLSKAFFAEHPFISIGLYALILVAVLGGGHLAKLRTAATRSSKAVSEIRLVK